MFPIYVCIVMLTLLVTPWGVVRGTNVSLTLSHYDVIRTHGLSGVGIKKLLLSLMITVLKIN